MIFKHVTQQKKLFTLALPMILSNITTPLLGIVDTAVVGHLDHAYYLGASTVGAMIITFITWLCGFLRMSTTGLSAQAYGMKNEQLGIVILLRGILVAFAIGFIIIILQQWYIDLSLSLAGGSEQIQFYARQYCQIRVWGLPAALANLVIMGWLLGNHKAKMVMWLMIVINLVNLLLDLLFVIGFSWQVKGVAWATLIAEYSGFFVAIFVVFNQFSQQIAAFFRSMVQSIEQVFNVAAWMDYFKLNRDILIRTLCLEICFVFITFQGARLGDDVVAANAILMNFLLFISFGLDGIANAAEVMVGKAKGENNSSELSISVQVSLLWTAIFAVSYCLLFLFAGEYIITLISSIPEVINQAKHYLPWIIVLPLLACWCYLFDGIYIGLMQAKVMRNSMIFSTFLCFFPLWWLLQGFGNHSLWAALSGFMLARGATLMWHYFNQEI